MFTVSVLPAVNGAVGLSHSAVLVLLARKHVTVEAVSLLCVELPNVTPVTIVPDGNTICSRCIFSPASVVSVENRIAALRLFPEPGVSVGLLATVAFALVGQARAAVIANRSTRPLRPRTLGFVPKLSPTILPGP